MRHSNIILLAVTLAPTVPIAAQVQMTIDLATEQPGATSSTPRPVASELSVLVLNRIPGTRYRYTLEVATERTPIPPLVLPALTGTVPGTRTFANRPPGNRVVTVCSAEDAKQLDSAVNGLQAAESETAIPAAVQTANQIISNEGEFSDCETAGLTIERLRELVRLTRWEQGLPAAAADEDHVVTITRLDTKSNMLVKWVKRYTGRPVGQWVTTYGFAFLTTWTAPSATYTAVESGTEGQFIIKEDRQEDQLRFAPAVFFTWQPDWSGISTDATMAFTGGLGFDLSSPVAMVGTSLVWRRNIAVHLGLAAARVDRLAKRYRVGEVVGTNLTPEQLRYSPYKINPYIALSFNFSTNPFASGSSSNEDSSKPAGTAQSSTPAPEGAPNPTPALENGPEPAPTPTPAPETTPAPAPAPDQ